MHRDMEYVVKGVNGYRFGYLKSLKPDTEPKEGDNKVVRGGAWNYRPKHSAAYVRNSYFAWQPANNVGFRVIIEE